MEQTLAQSKQLLSIQEQAEHFSFCKQLTGDQLLFGKEDAFPTVQHLSEAADAAEELSRCQPRQRSPILCQASQVNELVCFGVGREFDVATEHVIQKCLFPYPAVMRNHCHGSFCRMVRCSREAIAVWDAHRGCLVCTMGLVSGCTHAQLQTYSQQHNTYTMACYHKPYSQGKIKGKGVF